MNPPRPDPVARIIRWREERHHQMCVWLAQRRLGRAAMHFWCWAVRCGNRRFHWEGIQRELRGNRRTARPKPGSKP